MGSDGIDEALQAIIREGLRVVKGLGVLSEEACSGEVRIVKAVELLGLLATMRGEKQRGIPEECVLIVEPPDKDELRGLLK